MKKSWSTLIYCFGAYGSSLKQLDPHYLCQILGFWVTWGVKMMSLHHGLGWQPTQTASYIHITHIQSVWAYCYAVHAHVAVASNNYTHPSWLTLCGSGSIVESKWCHYVIAEANSQLKLLAASKLYIASNSYTHLTWIIFCDSGSLVESKWCRYVMVEADSHLKMLPASTSYIYKVI